MARKILVLPGDYIGPEIVARRCACWSVSTKRFDLGLELEDALLGGAALDAARGAPARGDPGGGARPSDAILLGPWAGRSGTGWSATCARRRACCRSARNCSCSATCARRCSTRSWRDASSLKPEVVAGLDILIVRELTGGIYFGEPRGIRTWRTASGRVTTPMSTASRKSSRIGRLAFESARKRGSAPVFGGQVQCAGSDQSCGAR